jgi:transposase-like protein
MASSLRRPSKGGQSQSLNLCTVRGALHFLAEIISHAVWLYFCFPLSLRNVDELLAARGIVVSHG